MWDVSDPSHRAVLRAARGWGVSPSVFQGRKLSTISRRAPDGSIVMESDAEWLESDTRAALLLAEYEADLCPGCNYPMSETTDPAKEFGYRALPPVRCHRCTTSDIASDSVQDLPHPSALHIPIVLRETQQ